MNFREKLGFAIISIGVVIMPFSWWTSRKWFFVAAGLIIAGSIVHFTQRMIERHEKNNEEIDNLSPKNPNIPLTGDVRGIHGSRAFDSSDSSDVD